MLTAQDETLLRMRAQDAGFDLDRGQAGEWLLFGASGNLATVWLTASPGAIRCAAAPEEVVAEVGPVPGAEALAVPPPAGAAGHWACQHYSALDALCRRIATLGHVLPDQVLRQYQREVAEAEQTAERVGKTERLAEVRQRVGQDLFRAALMKYWGGKCAITGCTAPELLRASHAKPWKDSTDQERLDVHNGLLLMAHLDAAFDAGLISVAEDGTVVVSPSLGTVERRVLGLEAPVRVAGLAADHGVYLAWHRGRVLRG